MKNVLYLLEKTRRKVLPEAVYDWSRWPSYDG